LEFPKIGGELGGGAVCFTIDQYRNWLVGSILTLDLSLHRLTVGLESAVRGLTRSEGCSTVPHVSPKDAGGYVRVYSYSVCEWPLFRSP